MNLTESTKERILAKRQAFQQVFNSPNGQVVLQELADQFMLSSKFVKGDPYATAYNCGAEDVVLFIKEVLEASETKS